MNSVLWKTMDFKGQAADLLTLFREEPQVFFLDSSLANASRGRYSFVGFDPFDVFQGKGENCLPQLKSIFKKYAQPRVGAPSPLAAGIVGYFAYDLGLYLEPVRLKARDDLKLPDCLWGLYDCILTIDHWTGKLHISSSGLPEQNSLLRKKRAQERLQSITRKLSVYKPETFKKQRLPVKDFSEAQFRTYLESNFTKEKYRQAVKKALDYIRCGDIYQVNLSQRFAFDRRQGRRRPEPLEIYRSLRDFSPSHFSAYFDSGTFQIMSSSPERFLRLSGRCVETRPMKGTRARGMSPRQDEKLKQDLRKSPKDRAELLMITDLERNDLGRVCDYGSVQVKAMRTLEAYRTVFQATSTIEGTLKKEADCFDLVAACFPGGSITGCPKIRAMEIIEELEPTRRGIYTGALGYIGFNGDMDLNILIRSLLSYRDKIYFQAGGGIVSDSTPDNEYRETLIKAGALWQCLQTTHGLV